MRVRNEEVQHVQAGDTIVVWFSCGVASAAALKITLEYYPQAEVRAVNNPIKEEHPDNRRFLHDVENWLGIQIECASHPDYPASSCVEIWEDRKYMSGVRGAPCTMLLKKKAREYWEFHNSHQWIVLGFTTEEKKRSDQFKKFERSNLLPVLIDAHLSKQDCYRLIYKAGIAPPEMYALGYPNANCIGCVKATSPTYWNHVRLTHPEVFKERAVQSRRLGAKLVRYKNKRLFLDELPREAKGRSMTAYQIECGVFCEGVK